MAVPSADGSPPGELPQVLHLQYTTRQKILRQGGAGARPTGTYRPSTCALGFTFISAWSLTIDATADTKNRYRICSHPKIFHGGVNTPRQCVHRLFVLFTTHIQWD